MNNKGFAITTILYGILVLFCLLLVSLLGILSSYRKTQQLLIEETNGARDIVNNMTHSVGNDDISSDEGGDDSGDNETYTVTFDCNCSVNVGGKCTLSSGKSPVTMNVGDSLRIIEYSCSGPVLYNFVGWNTDMNAKVGLDNDEYSYSGENKVTLYAIWETKGNGGGGLLKE